MTTVYNCGLQLNVADSNFLTGLYKSTVGNIIIIIRPVSTKNYALAQGQKQ